MSKMRFGPLGRLLEIPCPRADLGWDFGADTEVTPLDSGGRHVYRAPTIYRSFSMAWGARTEGLQPIIDLFNGVYGPGPFYLIDPNYRGGNILPPRWASSYQLRHSSDGWCDPVLAAAPAALAGSAAVFENRRDAVLGPSIIVPVPEAGLLLRGWGSATGGGVVRASVLGDDGWSLVADYTPSASPAELRVAAAGSAATMARLQLVIPPGGTLTLDHLNLTTRTEADRLGGEGIGAVMFTSALSGTVFSTAPVIARIGLSLDLTETE